MVSSPEKGIQEIADDNEHGADYLSNFAIEVLIKASQTEAENVDLLHERLWHIGVKLASIRPSMASIPNKIGYLFNELDRISDVETYRSNVGVVGRGIITDSFRNKKLIAANVKAVVGNISSVFTYSYSGTVVDVIKENGYKKVVVTESRPMMEGKALAKELGERGLNVTLTVDGALGLFVKEADACLIGADSVQYNGSVINKVGSRLLAYAAKDFGVPFYVLCDTNKFNVLNYLGSPIVLEEKNPEEVSSSLKNVTIKNPYFEVISSDLITGVITEEGFMEQFDIRQKMESMRKYVEPLYRSRK